MFTWTVIPLARSNFPWNRSNENAFCSLLVSLRRRFPWEWNRSVLVMVFKLVSEHEGL